MVPLSHKYLADYRLVFKVQNGTLMEWWNGIIYCATVNELMELNGLITQKNRNLDYFLF